MKLKLLLVVTALAVSTISGSNLQLRGGIEQVAITTCSDQLDMCTTACAGSQICIDNKCQVEDMECKKCETPYDECVDECTGAAPCISGCDDTFNTCQEKAKCDTERDVCERMAASCGGVVEECVTACAGDPDCEDECPPKQGECEEKYSNCDEKFDICEGNVPEPSSTTTELQSTTTTTECACTPPPECPCGGDDEDEEETPEEEEEWDGEDPDDPCIKPYDPCQDWPDMEYVPDLRNCHYYWACINGQGWKFKCPPKYKVFDWRRQLCVKGKRKRWCDRPFCGKQDRNKICGRRIKSQCKKYRQCLNGTVIPLMCGNGYSFDDKTEKCEKDWIADCLNCPLPQHDKDHDITRFPDRKDCNGFYVCSRGDFYPQNCMEGLHFNEKTGKCDLPTNAACNYSKFAVDENLELVYGESYIQMLETYKLSFDES